MHVWVAVLLLTVPVLGQMFADLNEQWEDWKSKYQKIYQDWEEMVYRRTVWEKNLKLILKHNQEASAGLHTFTEGLNHLADMDKRQDHNPLEYRKTAEEINTILNCLKMEDNSHWKNWTIKQGSGVQAVPQRVDWRERDMVSPVKNQGMCGSCWAFSAVGALEGQMKRRTGILIPLSPQNLVDCSSQDGNLGCRGGYISKAFNYIIRNKGIDSESFYPYEHKEYACRYSIKGKAAYCSGVKVILSHGNENTLKTVVATVGPVAVGINAMQPSFHRYKGGVYDEKDCTSRTLNHAVLVVGYGSANGQDYWLVKNSWGTGWGEEGYMRMARNKNLCGIANFAVYPTL